VLSGAALVASQLLRLWMRMTTGQRPPMSVLDVPCRTRGAPFDDPTRGPIGDLRSNIVSIPPGESLLCGHEARSMSVSGMALRGGRFARDIAAILN